MSENVRMGIHEYFLNIAYAASRRSTCPRRAVGAVLTKNGRVISTGYNGSPSGFTHCFGERCLFQGNCVNTIHAEINALINAREIGDAIYCTDAPCINCLKALLSHNPNIIVHYVREYNDPARVHFIELHPFVINQLIQREVPSPIHT